jgi:hypothetical protein
MPRALKRPCSRGYLRIESWEKLCYKLRRRGTEALPEAPSATLSPPRWIVMRKSCCIFFPTGARRRLGSHNVRDERVQARRHRGLARRGRRRSRVCAWHSSASHAVFALRGCLRLIARSCGGRFSLLKDLQLIRQRIRAQLSVVRARFASRPSIVVGALFVGLVAWYANVILQHPRAAAGWGIRWRCCGLRRRAVPHGADFASRSGKKSHARRCHVRRIAP